MTSHGERPWRPRDEGLRTGQFLEPTEPVSREALDGFFPGAERHPVEHLRAVVHKAHDRAAVRAVVDNGPVLLERADNLDPERVGHLASSLRRRDNITGGPGSWRHTRLIPKHRFLIAMLAHAINEQMAQG